VNGPKIGEKARLDVLLTERGLFESRSKASAAVIAGEVLIGIGRERASKPGQMIGIDQTLFVEEARRFVSRGGIKLDNALDQLEMDVTGLSCLDVGASTGGFTDCLLQRGAERVIALDVAYGELAWSLRQDPRVEVVERTNARHMEAGQLAWSPTLVVCDLSFIGVGKVFSAIKAVIEPGSDVLALVKPQFEVGKERLGSGGVVRDPELRREALVGAGKTALELGFNVEAYVSSGLPGPKGNEESFIHLKLSPPTVTPTDLEQLARRAEP